MGLFVVMSDVCMKLASEYHFTVVQTRPKLTLGAGHMTHPFYSTSEIVDVLNN